MVQTGALFACDRCHAKKTKCDKQNPCMKCIEANATCQRNRRKDAARRRRRPMSAVVRALTGNMHELESLLHERGGQEPRGLGRASDIQNFTSTQASDVGADYDMVSDSVLSEIDESRDQDTSDALGKFLDGVDVEAVLSQADKMLTRNRLPQAQKGNLRGNTADSVDVIRSSIPFQQGNAPERVLRVLVQFCQSSSHRDWSTASEGDVTDGSSYGLSPSDIIKLLTTPHPESSFNGPTSMIAPITRQMMGLSVLESQTQTDSKTLQYKVILGFEAAISLRQQKSTQNDAAQDTIQAQIELIKTQKFRDALAKLDQVTFRTAPSLPLLQAQCIGVCILQYFGNVPEAWNMMVAVSRTFIALGFDTTLVGLGSSSSQDCAATPTPAFSGNEHVQKCIAWCYQLDRSMSLILRRPPLLPTVSRVPILSPLSSSSSSRAAHSKSLNQDLAQILEEFAHIQGCITVLTAHSTPIAWKEIEPVHSCLRQLYSKIEKWKLAASDILTDKLHLDLVFLDFRYYSTQTTLLQQCAGLTTSTQLQRQVVNCACRTFDALDKLIQSEVGLDMVYIGWDLLLYSLSPLCVLSYSILSGQNASSLESIFAYSAFVRDRISPRNPLARKVHDLCIGIIGICKPFITTESPSAAAPAAPTAVATTTTGRPYFTNHTPHRKNFMNFDAFFANTNPLSTENVRKHTTEDSDEKDELLLKLLIFQPRLEWHYSPA